jgi:penicillin G amidase
LNGPPRIYPATKWSIADGEKVLSRGFESSAMNEIPTPHAKRSFTARRDTAGVPHIRATTLLDALYGLGYVHAIDRGTQLLFSRDVAEGTASGGIANREPLRETDCFFRRVGLHLGIDEDLAAMDPVNLRRVLVYCAGVNDGLMAKGRSLAMRATGFATRPWDPRAVLMVGRLLGFGGLAISQIQNERLLVDLIHAGARDAALAAMFEPRLRDLDFDLMRKVNISNQLSDEALELLTDLPRLAGSNAWAVAPQRSASGCAMLAADPHLEVNRLPAIWYEAVLTWEDKYVLGSTLPGMPLFSVGRTQSLAWGVTYMKGDTIDYFVEDCRPGGKTGWQYRRGDEWLDFRVRHELIEQKGESPLDLCVLENDLGTLESDVAEAGYYLSVAWASRRLHSSQSVETWLELFDCDTTSHAMDIVSNCPLPTLCFIFADRDGHIGMQGCGAIPMRPKEYAGLVPLAGWDVANHWNGWYSQELMPSKYDPPEGFVATANEENNPPNGVLLVTQTVHDYRLRRIVERLKEVPQATVEDFQRLQYDTKSMQAHDILMAVLPLMPDGWLKQRLTDWDCRYELDSVTAPLFQQFYRYLMMEMLGNDRGVGWRRMVYLCSRAGFSSMVLTAADRLWKKEQSWWWHGRDRKEIVRRAAARVVEKPGETWGDVNDFHFTDRFFGEHRVGKMLGFNSRRQGMRGCHATPFQGHVVHTAKRETTFAPSYHFVTDFAAPCAWTNLPGGPSESRFSRFYRNDIPLWVEGKYKRLCADVFDGN